MSNRLPLVRSWLWLVFPVFAVALAASPNNEPTRLLRSPTVSATQIAFAYANNIWVVERSGGHARRLTSFQGQTTNPRFSPDGQWVAFSGEYAGNTDVYVVPAEGGDPSRLTCILAATWCKAGPTTGSP
jgi:tricorn protease